MHGLRGREDQNSLPKAARRRLTVKGRFDSGPVLDQKYELTPLAKSTAHGAKVAVNAGGYADRQIPDLQAQSRLSLLANE